MQLTKDNLQEWKAEVNVIMLDKYKFENYVQETISDDQLLEDYEGITPQEYVDGEVEAWEE